MKFNSFEDLKCLKPKEVLEEEERQERRKELKMKAFWAAKDACNKVKTYYLNKKYTISKLTKPKLKEFEIVYDYIERHGLEYTDSKNTENDNVFYASELTKQLHIIQSVYIGESLSSFKAFLRKFI